MGSAVLLPAGRQNASFLKPFRTDLWAELSPGRTSVARPGLSWPGQPTGGNRPMIPNRTEAFRAHVSVRLDADRWATRRVRRRVLAVVHTVTAGQRLMDAVRLLEGDARLQVFFTAAPDVFNHGVAELLDRLKGLVLPWHQAVQTEFDLALAASHGGLHELQAPVVVLPHGAGHNKLVAPKGRCPRRRCAGRLRSGAAAPGA